MSLLPFFAVLCQSLCLMTEPEEVGMATVCMNGVRRGLTEADRITGRMTDEERQKDGE